MPDAFAIMCYSKFYEKEAVLMDPVDGPILASLLGNYFSVSIHYIILFCIFFKQGLLSM